MVIRELITKLGFETDESKVKSFENSIGSLTKGLTLLVAGATAATTAAFGLATSTARQSEEIARSARLANTSVEDFQKMAYASEAFGIEQEKLADILKDTSDKVGDFMQTGGGAMADFFEFIAPKVGVTAEQFKNLSGADALQLYVSSLEKANLSQADMTFYMEAIASDSTLLLPLLEKNGEAYKTLAKEAEEYGAVISEDNIKANKAFSQQLRSLNKMFQAVIMSVGNKLIPLFSDLVSKVKDFIAKNRELIQTNISDFFEGAIWAVEKFISIISTLIGWINKVTQALGGWKNTLKIVGIALGVLMALKFASWIMAVTVAIRALNIAMLLNPVGLIIAGVVALGTAIILLIEDIYHWVAGNESAIGDLLGSWEDFKNKFMGYITGAVDYVKNKFNEVSEAISGAFNSAIESVKNYFVSLYDDVTAFIDKIIGVFTSLKDKVSNIFGSVKDSIKSGLNAVLPETIASAIGIDTNTEINENILATPNITPTTQSVLGSSGNSLSSVVNDNKTINITVPPGATAEQVEAIKQQINKTMAQQYTDAAQHLEGY